jgi:hypothetical protein
MAGINRSIKLHRKSRILSEKKRRSAEAELAAGGGGELLLGPNKGGKFWSDNFVTALWVTIFIQAGRCPQGIDVAGIVSPHTLKPCFNKPKATKDCILYSRVFDLAGFFTMKLTIYRLKRKRYIAGIL